MTDRSFKVFKLKFTRVIKNPTSFPWNYLRFIGFVVIGFFFFLSLKRVSDIKLNSTERLKITSTEATKCYGVMRKLLLLFVFIVIG